MAVEAFPADGSADGVREEFDLHVEHMLPPSLANSGQWLQLPLRSHEATQDSTANGDVIDATGPGAPNGIFGAAHSGETFFGGGHTNPISATVSHEGLEQTVGGFTVGEEYSFSFFQANVGINNARDTAGSWRVYANGEWIGTTIPTSTTLEWNVANKATGLVWEERAVTFTAAAESITLSFLPYDTMATSPIGWGLPGDRFLFRDYPCSGAPGGWLEPHCRGGRPPPQAELKSGALESDRPASRPPTNGPPRWRKKI